MRLHAPGEWNTSDKLQATQDDHVGSQLSMLPVYGIFILMGWTISTGYVSK